MKTRTKIRIQMSILVAASALAAGTMVLAGYVASARQPVAVLGTELGTEPVAEPGTGPSAGQSAGPAALLDTHAFTVEGQVGGETDAVDVSGALAFVGSGPRVAVVDLADPARPALVGLSPILHGVVHDILVDGGVVYAITDPTSVNGVAGDDARLVALDVRDPSHPTPIGMLNLGGSNGRLAITESDLLWASVFTGDQGGGGKLMAIDARAPSGMKVLGELDLGMWALSITIVGERAVVSNTVEIAPNRYKEQMRVFEATPAIRELAAIDFAPVDERSTRFASIIARDGLLYAYVQPEHGFDVATPPSAFQIYDASDPARLALLGQVSFQVSLWPLPRMAIDGLQAFLVRTKPGPVAQRVPNPSFIKRVDLSDPRNPRLLPTDPSSPALDKLPRKIIVRGGTLFWVDNALRVLDYRSPSAPELLGLWRGMGPVSDVALASGYAYAIDRTGHLSTFRPGAPEDDLTPLSAMQAVTAAYASAYYESDHQLLAQGDRLFAGTSGELAELSLADPVRPAVTWSMFLRCRRLAAGDGLLYVAKDITWFGDRPTLPDGIEIFDIGSGAPQARGRWLTLRGGGIAAVGRTLYSANTNIDLEVLDMSDVERPTVRGKWLGNGASSVAVHGDLVLLTQQAAGPQGTSPAGLILLDASDPAAIRQVGFLPMVGSAVVVVDGDVAYVVDHGGWGDLVAVDISDPTTPAVLAKFPIHYPVSHVVVDHGTVWLPLGASGLWRLRLVPDGPGVAPGVEPVRRRVGLPWVGRF